MSQRPLVTARTYNHKGNLLATRANSYTKTHPLQAYFAKLVGKPNAIYLHAEIHAIVASGDTQIHRIEIERFNRQGEPVLAKPCTICQKAIKAFDIKEVEHT